MTSTCTIFSELGVILTFNTQSVPIDVEIDVNVVSDCKINMGLVHYKKRPTVSTDALAFSLVIGDRVHENIVINC